MGNGMFVGVSGTARGVKAAYIGAGGTARKATKIYVGVHGIARLTYSALPPSRLPAGYTEVEYVQSDGTSYLDSGVVPSSKLKMVMDIETLIKPSSGTSYLFYSQSTGKSGTTSHTRKLNIYVASSGIKGSMSTITGTVAATSITSDSSARRMTASFDYPNKKFGVDATLKAGSPGGYYPTASVKLLGSSASNVNGIKAKLYSCKFYESGVLTHDFVPCTNPDGTAGLYDLLNGAFLAAVTPSALTAGPVV